MQHLDQAVSLLVKPYSIFKSFKVIIFSLNFFMEMVKI